MIIINNGVTDLDVKADIYSAWKEWVQTSDNSKYFFAFDTPDGGREIASGKNNGDYYFLNNQDFPDGLGGTRDGWRIRPYEGDHTLTITGNLYISDVTKPYNVTTLGAYTVIVKLEVSPQTQQVVSGSGITEQDKEDIKDKVLNADIGDHQIANSIADKIEDAAIINKTIDVTAFDTIHVDKPKEGDLKLYRDKLKADLKKTVKIDSTYDEQGRQTYHEELEE